MYLKTDSKYQIEKNILLVIGSIGLARATFAIIYDLTHPEQTDLGVDIVLAVLFVGLLVGIRYFKSVRGLIFTFYVPLIFLLLVSFVLNKGLIGNTEHNLLMGFIVVCFTLKGKNVIIVSLLYFLGAISCLIYVGAQYSLHGSFQSGEGNSLNFIIAGIATIGFSYYVKYVFIKRREKLEENSYALKSKTQELTKKNQELQLQKQVLEELTKKLDKKVASRTKALKKKKSKREKYVSITMNELAEKHEQTMAIVEKICDKHGADLFAKMLRTSAEKLKHEFQLLKEKVHASS